MSVDLDGHGICSTVHRDPSTPSRIATRPPNRSPQPADGDPLLAGTRLIAEEYRTVGIRTFRQYCGHVTCGPALGEGCLLLNGPGWAR
jgi:hypothetical protein